MSPSRSSTWTTSRTSPWRPLTRDGHAGRTYELTGPRLLTFADVAAELTRATGREIGYLPITAAQYADTALAAGVPAEEIEPLSDLFRPRARRAQRAPDRRRRTGAGPPAPRLRRLRARHRGHRRLVARGRRRAPMIGS